MATLRNKRKLAAVAREATENTMNNHSQNTLDPEKAQEYISHTSQEIERRVTKKLSKEFSRTESRFLGASCKLDEFLLNPQVRTCSVAVPETSRKNDSENREPTGAQSRGDPCPEAVFSTYHSSILNDSERKESHHMATEVQEEIPYCSPGTSLGKQKKARSTNQPNFAVKSPLRQLKQTRFCWPFNNWRRTIFQPISTTSTESRNCPKPSQRQRPHLTENQRNSNCLKICSKQVWNFTINWQKKTKQTTSTLSCVVMRYKHSRTSQTPTEGFGRKFYCVPQKIRESSVNSYSKTESPTTGLQSSEPEVKWFSQRTPEISERCIRSCRSSDHWTIHIRQNASPPEEINQPGAFGEWHIWTACVTSWKIVWTESFRSFRWAANKYSDATSHTTKLRKIQTNLPSLQKRSLSEPVPSTQTRERPSPK